MADTPVLIAVVCFGVGMALQALLMLRGRFQRGDGAKALLSLAVGLLGYLPGRHESDYRLLRHTLYAFAAAGAMFAYQFRERLLPHVGGRLLLAWNILLVAVAIASGWNSGVQLFVLLIPTIPTVINAFTDIDRVFAWKVFFHAWFTTILVIVAILGYEAGPLKVFFESDDSFAAPPSPLHMIVGGGAFLYIVTNAWFVLALMPIAGRHQPWGERMAEIRRHMDLLARGYVWERDDPVRSLGVLVGLPLLLWAGARFGAVPIPALVAFAIAFMPLIAGAPPDAPALPERKPGRLRTAHR